MPWIGKLAEDQHITTTDSSVHELMRLIKRKSDRSENAKPLLLSHSNITTMKDGFQAPLFYLKGMENSPKTSVLFNANCPVCNFEIQHYARYAVANDLPIRFDDLNSDARDQWGLDADTAARRLYVLHEGSLTSGVPAFVVLWTQMPKYRWLARVAGLPGIRQVACAAYDFVLAPAIYRWHLLRLRKQSNRSLSRPNT